MSASTTNINQQRLLEIQALVVQDSLLHGEPVTPEGMVCALAFHEGVEVRKGFGVLAEPGESIDIDVVGLLEGSVHGIVGNAVVCGVEVFGCFLDEGEKLEE